MATVATGFSDWIAEHRAELCQYLDGKLSQIAAAAFEAQVPERFKGTVHGLLIEHQASQRAALAAAGRMNVVANLRGPLGEGDGIPVMYARLAAGLATLIELLEAKK